MALTMSTLTVMIPSKNSELSELHQTSHTVQEVSVSATGNNMHFANILATGEERYAPLYLDKEHNLHCGENYDPNIEHTA